jgi:hypothetical protein
MYGSSPTTQLSCGSGGMWNRSPRPSFPAPDPRTAPSPSLARPAPRARPDRGKARVRDRRAPTISPRLVGRPANGEAAQCTSSNFPFTSSRTSSGCSNRLMMTFSIAGIRLICLGRVIRSSTKHLGVSLRHRRSGDPVSFCRKHAPTGGLRRGADLVTRPSLSTGSRPSRGRPTPSRGPRTPTAVSSCETHPPKP